MSLAPTVLTSSYNNADQASYTTASISPGGERYLCLEVFSSRTAPTAVPTISGLSLTWIQEATVSITPAASEHRLTRFYARTPVSPGSGTITIDFGAATQGGCAWAVLELSADIDHVDPFVQSLTANPGTSAANISVTLAAYNSANNRPLIAIWHLTNEASAEEAGYTELVDHNGATPNSGFAVAYHPTSADTTPSYSWVTATTSRLAIASEMRAFTVSAPPIAAGVC